MRGSPPHCTALRQLRTSSIHWQLYLPLSDRVCLACQARHFPDPVLHFVRDCPVFYEIRGRFPCLFPADTRTFSIRDFLSYEDQACVASCVSQFLRLFHAYRTQPSLQARLRHPHLTRSPLLVPPRRPLAITDPAS